MNRTLPERIFICGFMGAGKSTLGRVLAAKLALPFHDLDDFIEEENGRSIKAIFEADGEAAFRREERKAILTLIREEVKGVIALGGGSLHNQFLLDHIKVNGLLVFIDTPLATIMQRIMEQPHRPLLLDDEGKMKERAMLKNELQALFEERFPLYEQAEVSIRTEDYATNDEMATELVKKIEYHVALH